MENEESRAWDKARQPLRDARAIITALAGHEQERDVEIDHTSEVTTYNGLYIGTTHKLRVEPADYPHKSPYDVCKLDFSARPEGKKSFAKITMPNQSEYCAEAYDAGAALRAAYSRWTEKHDAEREAVAALVTAAEKALAPIDRMEFARRFNEALLNGADAFRDLQ